MWHFSKRINAKQEPAGQLGNYIGDEGVKKTRTVEKIKVLLEMIF